jgi:hypothetical protein
MTTIGLDIAKSVFQVHGVDAGGQVIVRRQLKRRWNHFRECPVSPWGRWRTIAMRIEFLAAIAIVAAAGAGLAVHSVGSLPPEKQSTPAAAQLATLLAESVDPFLHRSGG